MILKHCYSVFHLLLAVGVTYRLFQAIDITLVQQLRILRHHCDLEQQVTSIPTHGVLTHQHLAMMWYMNTAMATLCYMNTNMAMLWYMNTNMVMLSCMNTKM